MNLKKLYLSELRPLIYKSVAACKWTKTRFQFLFSLSLSLSLSLYLSLSLSPCIIATSTCCVSVIDNQIILFLTSFISLFIGWVIENLVVPLFDRKDFFLSLCIPSITCFLVCLIPADIALILNCDGLTLIVV